VSVSGNPNWTGREINVGFSGGIGTIYTVFWTVEEDSPTLDQGEEDFGYPPTNRTPSMYRARFAVWVIVPGFRFFFWRFFPSLALGFLFAFAVGLSGVWGQELDPQKLDFFETKIRPVLVEKCYECHSGTTPSGELGGKLRVDSAVGLKRGGTMGPALEVGKSGASLLIRVMEYTDASLQMPPDGKLSEETIADFRRWVDEGAVDPRLEQGGPVVDSAMEIARQTQQHWAYRPLVDPPVILGVAGVPDSGDLVDRSIGQKLHEKGLGFSPEADRRTLVRRLYYDLLGLVPTYEEIEQVQGDTRGDWYERLVDQLLESPHYGERMARRWMDVVRYADNKGYVFQEDREYKHAFRYRRGDIRTEVGHMFSPKPHDQRGRGTGSGGVACGLRD